MAQLAGLLRKFSESHSFFSFIRRHLSTCHRDNAKLGVFLHKLIEKSKKRHPQQYVYSAPNSTVPSAPRKVQERTRRQQVLNAVFMENLSNIMVTADISEKLKGCAVQLTQVRISADCTHLNVYWITSLQEHGADKRVAELLQSHAGFLKSELIKSGFVGKAPKITFVKDVTYGRGAEVERLIDKVCADIPANLDITENVRDELPDSESGTENVEASATDGVPSKPYVPPDMKVDIYGLDRAAVMRQVLLKTKGLGRTPLEAPNFLRLRPWTESSEEAQARISSLAEYVQHRKLKGRLQIKAEREAQRSLFNVQGNLHENHPAAGVAYPEVDYEVDIDEEVEDQSNVSFLDEQER